MTGQARRTSAASDKHGLAILNRREMLLRSGGGFGFLAFINLLAEETSLAAPPGEATGGASLLAAKPPHHPPKAKRVISLYMGGGPSQMDTFDPKPRLRVDHGKAPPQLSHLLFNPGERGTIMASPFQFKKYGQSGIEVSELFPQIASCVDDLCIIRSLMHEEPNHPGAARFLLTGDQRFIRPSVGAWVTYGLGAANRNLPAFVAISYIAPEVGSVAYGNAFLPAVYQGTHISNMKTPIRNLHGGPVTLAQQRRKLDTIQLMNRLHLDARQEDNRLNARIETFELAYRMQTQSPEAFDISKESAATKSLYGIGTEPTHDFGQRCLLARRLLERGVRFVQLFDTYPGQPKPWDNHDGLQREHLANARRTDLPIAGLLKDLKSRGLLEDTLVIWGGEFGRLPMRQGGDGRDHNPYGFTMWLAGGGVKGGMIHGMTDEFGIEVVRDRVHVHDLHATVLHLLGLNHEKLTYRYGGRDFRLTDVAGTVVKKIIA